MFSLLAAMLCYHEVYAVMSVSRPATTGFISVKETLLLVESPRIDSTEFLLFRRMCSVEGGVFCKIFFFKVSSASSSERFSSEIGLVFLL